VLALALLERESVTEPELLWKSLASFLCDAVGNSHRAEINIEKLWNPYLPGRGRLGLVEFRGLRMQHTPQRATAIACLLRAVIAMLATRPYALPLIDWGRELHDRFALPFYLQADLDTVLAELDAAGLGLEAPIQAVLRHDAFRFLGKVDLPFGTLELWRGLEFWPLVGDAASPEQSGSSRFVDASTTRIEIRWRPPSSGFSGHARTRPLAGLGALRGRRQPAAAPRTRQPGRSQGLRRALCQFCPPLRPAPRAGQPGPVDADPGPCRPRRSVRHHAA
jgi:uncharacterized protein (DUF2126 family)